MSTPSKQYTLQLIRVVSSRLKRIDEEVRLTGVALSQGLIDAKLADFSGEFFAPSLLSQTSR
jgi:hypothetical protein